MMSIPFIYFLILLTSIYFKYYIKVFCFLNSSPRPALPNLNLLSFKSDYQTIRKKTIIQAHYYTIKLPRHIFGEKK